MSERHLPDLNNVHVLQALVISARGASNRPVMIPKDQHHGTFKMKQRKTGYRTTDP